MYDKIMRLKYQNICTEHCIIVGHITGEGFYLHIFQIMSKSLQTNIKHLYHLNNLLLKFTKLQ